VDRGRFSELVTARVGSHPRVELVREEAASLPEENPCVVATGPLTSSAIAGALQAKIGGSIFPSSTPWLPS
jgi:methylenetetrahydrofolate--tRNA-(uracil-5-)-methyltransferase